MTTKVTLCLVAWFALAGTAAAARARPSLPAKEAARIAKVPTTILGDADLASHLRRIHGAVEARVSAEPVLRYPISPRTAG
jgi:hypothetical protein